MPKDGKACGCGFFRMLASPFCDAESLIGQVVADQISFSTTQIPDNFSFRINIQYTLQTKVIAGDTFEDSIQVVEDCYLVCYNSRLLAVHSPDLVARLSG